MRKYQIDEQYFTELNRPQQSYIIGFLWADGHLRGDGYGVTIKINKRDRNILEYIKEQLESTHPIKPRSCNRIILDLCSVKLAARLKALGFESNKTFATHLPNYGADPLPFIRGLFDGDGSIHQDKKGQWHMQITGNHTTCSFVKRIVKCGNVYRDNSVFKWQVGGSRQVQTLSQHLLQYNELPVTRKTNKLMEASRYGNA